MPACPSSPTVVVVGDVDPVSGESADVPAAAGSLLAALSRVVDPRKPRGVRHRLPVILAVALSATLAGARSFTAVAEWVADAPPAERSRLGVTGSAPSESTIRRTLQRLDPDGLDELVGAWTRSATGTAGGRRVIAFDGKTLRGAKDAAGSLTHLLAGLCHRTGVVVGQCAVGAKTNEIPMLAKLLATFDIADAVVSADALHCQRATAEHITERGGHYILTVKGNQPKLRKQLKSLPWKQVPVAGTATERGHGRTEKRVLKATGIAEGILFPHADQVLQLTRTTTRRTGGKRHTEVVYAVTSLSAVDAQPGQVADWLRGHWHIENQLHWVRDVAFGEDRSQIRTQGGPQVMATLRNTAISLLRLDGHDNIAAALRHHARDHHRPINLLLTS